VWRHDDVLEPPEWRVLGERFGFENVERTAGDRPGFDCRDQRRFVDDRSAGNVDEVGVLAHRRELLGSDHSLGFGCVRDGHCDETCVRDRVVEVVRVVDRGDARNGIEGSTNADDVHPERVGTPGNTRPERTQSEDAEPFVRDCERPIVVRFVPVSPILVIPIDVQTAGQRQHVSDRHLTDSRSVNPGAVSEWDPGPFVGVGVELVVPRPDTVDPRRVQKGRPGPEGRDGVPIVEGRLVADEAGERHQRSGTQARHPRRIAVSDDSQLAGDSGRRVRKEETTDPPQD
jgi:hypothetical protein